MKLNKTLFNQYFPATDQTEHSLADLADNYLVVYFYPKDNTPGCTQEGKDFSVHYKKFIEAGANVVGISKDSAKKHDNFKTKFGFPFTLIADVDEKLCQAFDVIKEKSMYGKKYMGIERSTFILDSNGKVVEAWRKVKVADHVEAVLATLQQLP